MMRKRLAMLLACALLLTQAAGAACTAGGGEEGEAEAELVQELSEYENGEVLVINRDGSCSVQEYASDEALEEGLETLAEDASVEWFQPNYTYQGTALSVNDTLISEQWALSNDGSFHMEEEENRYPVYDDPFGMPMMPGQWMMPDLSAWLGGWTQWGKGTYSSSATTTTAVAGIDINVQQAWETYQGGSRDVVIALIDTGVDYNHEELKGSIWTNTDEIADNGIDDDGNGYVDDVNGWNFYSNNNQIYVNSTEDSHGTHGAGTILAEGNNGVGISGIVQSDHVKIMVLKALGGLYGEGSTASVLQAIRYAEANGASICNLSLGSSQDDRALYQAIAASSMLFVTAAGNDSADLEKSPCYPASYDLDNIISVANLNYDGTLHYSSNYGTESVDLAAPGCYILSTTPNDGYSYMTGTSMSAPMVTAAAAMVYSHYPDISLADVREILLNSAKSLSTLTGKVSTGGMLDLGAAMNYDLTKLSGVQWTPIAASKGSSPQIDLQQISQGRSTWLAVQVYDADGDLTVTAYGSGTLAAEDFQGGEAGTKFSLRSDGTAIFSVTGSGTYTFYAKDAAGNESVSSCTVSGQQGGGWNGGGYPWYWYW